MCDRLPARGVIGMKWVRSKIRVGARAALFALAVQLALSFGHFHPMAAQTSPSIQSAQQLPASAPDSDQHPDDFCAICAVVALASTAMAAAPPALPLPQAVELPRRTIAAAFLHLHATRVAFQSRAPPLS
ncbi:MAG: DUF2946 family protein [Bradyrhizobium sp.]|uniref:DUF2946 family protein n=1 Tax=Bradyrhizobium sp. TaxID=376 RepID=UPI003BAF23B9